MWENSDLLNADALLQVFLRLLWEGQLPWMHTHYLMNHVVAHTFSNKCSPIRTSGSIYNKALPQDTRQDIYQLQSLPFLPPNPPPFLDFQFQLYFLLYSK